MKRAIIVTASAVVLLLGVMFYFQKPSGSILGDSAKKQKYVESLSSSYVDSSSSMSLISVLKKIVGKTSKYSGTAASTGAVYGGARSDVKAKIKRQFTPEEERVAEKYFKDLVKYQKPQKLYQLSQQIFGNSISGEGAARWITLGLAFDSSARYGDTLNLAIKNANSDPAEIVEKINQSIESIRGQPFLYQMVINLVHHLDLEPSVQAKIYGGELEYQLKSLKSEKGSDALWISVIGMKLAQQSGVNVTELAAYLDRGLNESKGSPKLLAEIKETAQYYFPDMVL